ncbi:MAG: hypothetical protein M3280_02510 [Actinomycetota bacterium]|nr:hypothetical protein [Actinomycetota bacterium]
MVTLTVGSLEVAARGGLEKRLQEFAQDPILTLACIALIAISIAWLIVARLIARNLKRAAELGPTKVDQVRPPRDIWSKPP